MIIITGAAGFIGSCFLQKMNDEGFEDIMIVDDFSRPEKNVNFLRKKYISRIHRNDFLEWLRENGSDVDIVFHLGARTDTTEMREVVFDTLNLNYSKSVWESCARHNIPLIYASSAATYGLGELGFDDDHAIVEKLKPLNPYGKSKNDFDKWVLQQEEKPPFWTGLKFFNVYGPNEYHKGRMASVIFHTVKQIRETGKMKLFKSHKQGIDDGQQSRDFIYVKDVIDVLFFLYKKIHDKKDISGLYNLGTGKARSFWDLATNTFKALDLKPDITFIDTPEDIRDTYQYFTEANMKKLRFIGYDKPFYSLEDGIEEYVRNYLVF